MATIKLNNSEWDWSPNVPLGEAGGFGQVFEGQGSSGRVAVKRLKLDANALAHREMTIAQELAGRELEWVIPVLDSGKDANSDAYFVVMPIAEGDLAAELGRRGALPEDEAIEILRQVANGIAEVDDLVHRDIKPENVLFHDGRWKLADFGIARFVEDSTSSQTLKAYLSAPYAAPEQWNNEHATKATDIYALGCVAHALLEDKPPFPGPSREDFQHQHLNDPAPEVAAESARLRGLITGMLRKAPGARPLVGRVLDQLDTVADGIQDGPGVVALATAGAKVAEVEAVAEAARESSRRESDAREALASEARAQIDHMMHELWEAIRLAAGSAKVISDQELELGQGRIAWGMTHTQIPRGAFFQSGWDVVCGGVIRVGVHRGYTRSASLWYARIAAGESYRWWEVPYRNGIGQIGQQDQPFALDDLGAADLAASQVTSSYQLAAAPIPIDDEEVDSFQERWMGRLAAAADGTLARPSSLPE